MPIADPARAAVEKALRDDLRCLCAAPREMDAKRLAEIERALQEKEARIEALDPVRSP